MKQFLKHVREKNLSREDLVAILGMMPHPAKVRKLSESQITSLFDTMEREYFDGKNKTTSP